MDNKLKKGSKVIQKIRIARVKIHSFYINNKAFQQLQLIRIINLLCLICQINNQMVKSSQEW